MKKSLKILAAAGIALVIPLMTSAAPPGVALPNAVNSSAGTNESLNWSGYVSTNGPFTGASATWNIPTVAAASSTMADATWVGIGGVTSRDLIQAGTQALTDRSGDVAYQAWYELLPENMRTISLPVNAGDSISVSIVQTASTAWQISFVNNTTGDTYQTLLDYDSNGSSAEWVQEMPTSNIGVLPLDNFGTLFFSNGQATRDGTNETIAETGAEPMTMVTPGGAVLSLPSPLASNGESFSLVRTSVALPQAVREFHPIAINTRKWGPVTAEQILQFLRAQFGFRF